MYVTYMLQFTKKKIVNDNILNSFVPSYDMNYTHNNSLDRLFHLSIIYDAKYHY